MSQKPFPYPHIPSYPWQKKKKPSKYWWLAKKFKKRQFASCHRSYQTCLGWLLQLWLNGKLFFLFKKITHSEMPLPYWHGLHFSLFFVPCGVLLRNAYSWKMKVTLYFSRTSTVKLFLKQSPGINQSKKNLDVYVYKLVECASWWLEIVFFVIHALCFSQYTLINRSNSISSCQCMIQGKH